MSFVKDLKLLIKLSYKSNPFHPFFLYIDKRQLTNALTSLMLVMVALILVSYFLVFVAEVAIAEVAIAAVFVAEVAIFWFRS